MSALPAALIDWLLLPLSGATDHRIAPWASWHGRLMVLAWAVLLPLGVMAARFFKVMPGQDWPRRLDHKAWWHAHRALQYAGVAVMSLGIVLAWGHAAGATALARWHGWLGWILLALGWLQVVGGWLRGSKGGPSDATLRGDHYDMSLRRRVFERLHKALGYLALALAMLTITLGLAVADAPRWMWLGIAAWWMLWLAGFVRLQRRGRCIDTYQAIWGPGDEHPGNRMPVIGWGVRRYSAEAWARRMRELRRTPPIH
ncbi:cytochrome b561 domain-containing protein [Xylophilus sp. ASV27]|uniref:cytochrome b561 domain-containing protein n=1 Tax=Xylophilus sp. ASV27 TaxID=2795129 RepID=UPI001E329B52|nr:cytochrome b561 domain-containing protein [Xylophilus sp. ASV27]